MYLMNRICFIILLFSAIVVGGCDLAARKDDGAPIGGIKLGHLATGSDEKTPPQLYFRVFTFELPTEQIDLLQQAFKLMSKRQIQFAERDAFDANGFLAGFGNQADWPKLSAELDKLAARKTATRNLVVYQAAGDDIAVTLLNSTEEVAWIDAGGKVKRDRFAVGRFTWMLKAQPMESIRGVAQVQIMPAYRLGSQGFFANLAHMRDDTPFSVGELKLRMSPGDYLLVASAGEPVGLDGRAIAPFTINRLLFYSADRPNTVRMYMVLCARIED